MMTMFMYLHVYFQVKLTMYVIIHWFLECQRSMDHQVSTSCANDVVTITWPTNLQLSGNVKTIPADVRQTIEDELKERTFILDMVIYTRVPP